MESKAAYRGAVANFCPNCDDLPCPICRSKMKWLEYRGHNPEKLAIMKIDGFRGFFGCVRVDLHDKVVDGVDWRGMVFVRPLFKRRK